MFAFAILDRSSGRLVLARDPFGIKPLFLLRKSGGLAFASELKALLPLLGDTATVDESGVVASLIYGWLPDQFCMYRQVSKLPPGHWLEWSEGELKLHAYWRLEFEPDTRQTLEGAKEQLEWLMRDSVREQLAADVPLGVWSSGGLDSSTIVHYASDYASGRLKTFSVSFRGRSFDETPYFREVARRYGTVHQEFDLNPECGLAEAIEELAQYSDEPSGDAGAVPVWFLSKMSRREVTVALSGEGADEIFGGYQTYLADHYARRLGRLPRALLRAGVKIARRLPVSDEKIGWDYKIKRLLEGSLLPPVEAHFYWNGTFSSAARRELLEPVGFRDADEPLTIPREGVGYLNRFLWLDQLNYLPDDILYKSDRMSMAHSLEVRPPFLDHRIVEFAARLPESLKIRGGRLKFILRELMRDRLPRPVLTRKKEGFDIPAHDWLRGVLRPLLLDTLNQRAAADSGVFSWPAIESVLRAHSDRRANLGYHLWGLLVLFLWMRHWRIGAPSGIGQREKPAVSALI